nr:acyltransferase domain-containing protein [Streptomyces clavuligerus]
MGRSLLAGSVVFAEWIAACERALVPFTGWSLTAVLRGVRGAPSLERVDVVQPVLFAVMVSLAELWRSCGVVPDAVVGHSQGEIAAAYVAGALTLDDAARVVALRSRELLRLAGTGGMVSLAVPEDQARRLVLPHGERIGVAAVNGPEAVVVAGEPAALDALLATCARDGIRARRLPVDYAAHSAQVAGAGDGLRTALADLRPRPCAIPLCSTVTGEPVDGARLDAEHWYRNLREPVAFAAAVEHLIAAGHDLFVEISPHPVLTAAIEATAERAGRDVAAVGTLRRDDGGGNRLLTSLAEAWTHGAPSPGPRSCPPRDRPPRPAHLRLPARALLAAHPRQIGPRAPAPACLRPRRSGAVRRASGRDSAPERRSVRNRRRAGGGGPCRRPRRPGGPRRSIRIRGTGHNRRHGQHR